MLLSFRAVPPLEASPRLVQRLVLLLDFSGPLTRNIFPLALQGSGEVQELGTHGGAHNTWLSEVLAQGSHPMSPESPFPELPQFPFWAPCPVEFLKNSLIKNS